MWSKSCGLSKEVDGIVNGSLALANCTGGDEILLVNVEVVVCFVNLMRQYSRKWILVATSNWIVSSFEVLQIIVEL
jgi:hypothetical protein